MQIFLNPNFCPFILLIYNKEAGKNFSYSDTLCKIASLFCTMGRGPRCSASRYATSHNSGYPKCLSPRASGAPATSDNRDPLNAIGLRGALDKFI